jgi:hypothetical protein
MRHNKTVRQKDIRHNENNKTQQNNETQQSNETQQNSKTKRHDTTKTMRHKKQHTTLKIKQLIILQNHIT